PNLLRAIAATEASQVWVTHGFTGPVVRWLTEHGIDAHAVQTRFEGERDDEVIEGVQEAEPYSAPLPRSPSAPPL
ncbi:MAG TPA: DNA ligase-associated DEXH box helicase, partial [Gemmatimonadales bacterium]|nr:DNA ligase-associated DEXH box helicase [Gemmatimonadales bacterium]